MKVVIPMAGAGSRFAKQGQLLPKPLIPVQGVTLIEHAIRSFDVDAEFIFVTRKFDNPDHNVQLSELLKSLRPEHVEIQLDHVTQGASDSVLAAREYIDNSDPLVVYNCDQILNWDPQEFLTYVQQTECAGAIVLHKSSDPKNSFAQIDKGQITKVVEKKPVSEHALVGFHYWAHGADFVWSAQQLKQNFQKSGTPECYVSETYNYLIQQHARIIPYHVAPHVYVPLGTPEDVTRYVGKRKEFHAHKPKTIFCDIDGTILQHLHAISDVITQPAHILPGVREKLNEWDSLGYHIVLTTARKESVRVITEQQLLSQGIVWDQLIMGITSGVRVLINDKLSPHDPDRAVGMNMITNQGWHHTDWSVHGL
jgi:NDP-sugar pyrophosphorylase family protein